MNLDSIPDNATLEDRSRWECFCLIPSQVRRLRATDFGKTLGYWAIVRLVIWGVWHRFPMRVVLPAADSFNGKNSGSQPANTGSTPVSATN